MNESALINHRKTTSSIGVYVRQSLKRVFNGMPDSCFDISYQIGNRLIWEKVGWESEGYSLEIAQEIRAERMRAIRHGMGIVPHKTKAPYFRKIAEKYLEWAKDNKSGKARDDHSRYKKHLSPRFDHLRVNEVSPFLLEGMKGELMKEGLSIGSVEHILKLFRQIINKAKLWGLYEGENPIKGVRIPNAKNGRIRFLSYEEARKLLAELKKVSPQVHDIALISLHTGMRAGEIFNMRNHDVDFISKLISIPDSKNGQGRKAFMTNAIKEILSKRINGQPGEYVFKTEKGSKLNEVSDTFCRTVERLGFNEGIEDRRYKVCFHTLRHTFASWLASQGESLMTIKELMGHKTLEMTLRYAHLMPDQKRQAAMRLERAFGEGDNNTQ